MRFRLPLAALLSLWVLGAALPDARATEKEPLALAASVASARLPQSLSALPERAKVRLDAVPLDAQGSQFVALNLEKFTVFAPDAVVVVDSGSANERRLAPPAMAHFRGEVEGYPGSSAFWSVDETGHMKGILHVGEQIIVTEQSPGSPLKIAAPTSRPVDKSSDFSGRNFQCDVEQAHLLDFFQPSKPGQSKAAPPVAELSNTVYTARIALETDYEFFQLFGSQTAAAQYIADLFGYVSSTYAAEVKTNLQVGDVYLYSTSSDPWSASTTSAALNEVQAYWLANRSAVTRTLTHFMSGKGNGQGGIAYVGVLCDGTYGYGVSMSLGGHFSAANPQIVWDSVAIAHEIGHNFGSPHTHEWDTYLSGSPVDCCYRNTASGSVCSTTYGSLPGIGSLTGGSSGSGAGTIMSYCHQLSPGYSNLTLTFGLNHTKGISPARVPTQMRTTVENAAAAAPSCLVAGTMLGQSIAFGAAPSVVVGGTGTLSATASSGLPVVFSSLTASICTVSGSNGSTVLGVAAGTCNIAANQAGNSSTSAAPQVTQSFAIAAAPTYTLSVNSSGAAGVAIGASPSLYAGTTDYSKTGLAAGTSLTLTAPAAAGSALFSNWSGCDTASGVTCTLTMNAAKSVSAGFSSTPVAPSPPAITSITAGSGSATLHFSPPSNTGGLPISGYTATCTASGQTPRSASGSSSPLTVKSLTGGVPYQCSLTATNSSGLTSTASATLPVTPRKKSNLTPILLLLLD